MFGWPAWVKIGMSRLRAPAQPPAPGGGRPPFGLPWTSRGLPSLLRVFPGPPRVPLGPPQASLGFPRCLQPFGPFLGHPGAFPSFSGASAQAPFCLLCEKGWPCDCSPMTLALPHPRPGVLFKNRIPPSKEKDLQIIMLAFRHSKWWCGRAEAPEREN